MTVWMLFNMFMFLKLSHFVYSFADTGNLMSYVVFMVNTLASGHLDGFNSIDELCLSNSLITGFNSSKYFLYSGLNTGFDSLISISSYASYQNSLLC